MYLNITHKREGTNIHTLSQNECGATVVETANALGLVSLDGMLPKTYGLAPSYRSSHQKRARAHNGHLSHAWNTVSELNINNIIHGKEAALYSFV